jgi:hypothetical protein
MGDGGSYELESMWEETFADNLSFAKKIHRRNRENYSRRLAKIEILDIINKNQHRYTFHTSILSLTISYKNTK